MPLPPPKPFIQYRELVVPFDSDPKYHYWAGGQPISKTLEELGATEEVKRKYMHINQLEREELC